MAVAALHQPRSGTSTTPRPHNVMTNGPWGDRSPRDAAEFVRGLWRVGREAADKKKQVVQAVRDAGHGKTREQLRSLFEDEMARHGVPRDPIWVERQLDEFEWSPSERVQQTAQRLLLVGGALGRLAQSRGIPEAPSWMQPPEDASYHAWAPRGEKTPVDVDPHVSPWLERALASAPGHVGELIALVDVWFDWADGAGEDSAVAVYLGRERVGVLNPHAAERFMPVMQSAAKRDAKPHARAQLAKAMHLQPPYLLVVDVPVPDTP
jgi:hypothetical protein